MRVGGPGKTNSTAGAKGGKSASKSGAKFSVPEEEVESATASGVPSASPIGSIDAIMALQGISDSTEQNEKTLEKGENLLEKLDEIRHGLLMGKVSPEKLMQLKDTLASYNISESDPKLAEIVKDIEVRAAVELAKFGY
ncbi:MAG: flagellar assembly protein FliX [Sneathiella sp.]|uniref:flagellar assembly protein FliX n=1 Tax=Sneathiella sp. TaxID=1964365 RepID=UPI0030013F93